MNRIIARAHRELTQGNRFWNSSAGKCLYPYKFGGIEPRKGTSSQQYLTDQLFGSNIKNQFSEAYVAVLSALRDKDKAFLLSTMEPNLTKHIQLQDVQLINEGALIEANVANGFLATGIEFDRSKNNFTLVSLTQEPMELLVPPIQSLMGLRQMSVLIGFQIYFESKIKLVKTPKDGSSDRTEHHMIQFEVNKKYPLMESLKVIQKMNEGIKKKQVKEVISMLLGNDYQWKISDMDKVLNRNLKIDYSKKLPGIL